MERFVIIVNGFQPLTIITKHSILDGAAALDPPLHVLMTASQICLTILKSPCTAQISHSNILKIIF